MLALDPRSWRWWRSFWPPTPVLVVVVEILTGPLPPELVVVEICTGPRPQRPVVMIFAGPRPPQRVVVVVDLIIIIIIFTTI